MSKNSTSEKNDCVRCNEKTSSASRFVCKKCIALGYKAFVCKVCKERHFSNIQKQVDKRRCIECQDKHESGEIGRNSCLKCGNKTASKSFLLCTDCYALGFKSPTCRSCEKVFVHNKNSNTDANRVCPSCKKKAKSMFTQQKDFCVKIGEIPTKMTLNGFITFCKKNFKKDKKMRQNPNVNPYETGSFGSLGICDGCKVGVSISKGKVIIPKNNNLTFFNLKDAA